MFCDKDLSDSEKYRHAMDDLNDAVHGLERRIGQEALPVVTEFAKELIGLAETANTVTGPLGGIGTEFKALGEYVKSVLNPIGFAKDELHFITGLFSDGAPKVKDFSDAIFTAGTQSMIYAQDSARLTDKIYDAGAGFRDYAANAMAGGQALADHTRALKDATKATDDFRQATKDLVDDQLGLEGSIYSARDAIDAYTAKTKDHSASLRDMAESALAAEKAFKQVADQALVTAEAQATLHGTTLSARDAVDAQIAALQGLKEGLDPATPLRVWLDEYIGKLLSIPGSIVTNVDIAPGAGVSGAQGLIQLQNQPPSSGTGKAIVSNIKAYESSNGTGWRTGPQ